MNVNSYPERKAQSDDTLSKMMIARQERRALLPLINDN
jgi:hypothetical protein